MIVIRVKVLAVMIRPGIIGLRRRWISAGPETQSQPVRTKKRRCTYRPSVIY
jgi:hypothetical protein